MQVFLSHSHADRLIALAVKDLLEDIFGDEQISVDFSTDPSPGKGVSPGEEWHEWIRSRVQGAAVTIVILTPRSKESAWVLWEAGAVDGYGAATERANALIPLVFGLGDQDVPGPLLVRQFVRGDSQEEDGVVRLLQLLNETIRLPTKAFDSVTADYVSRYVEIVSDLASRSVPAGGLLSSIPNSFPAKHLSGYWVTAYRFWSEGEMLVHADVAEIVHDVGRRLSATNRSPSLPLPRTDRHRSPFLNEIEFDLISRHLVGRWRNLNDTRYFGSIHLAVLTGERVMRGHYTALQDDVLVNCAPWTWVRMDMSGIPAAELAGFQMRDPQLVLDLVERHRRDDDLLTLTMVAEPRT